MWSKLRLWRLPAKAKRGFSSAAVAVGRRHPLFDASEIAPDVCLIRERFFVSWNAANIFFVRSSSADLLVDAGK